MLKKTLQNITAVSNELERRGVTKLREDLCKSISQMAVSQCVFDDDKINRVVNYIIEQLSPENSAFEHFAVTERPCFADDYELTNLGEAFCTIFNVDNLNRAFVAEVDNVYSVYIEYTDYHGNTRMTSMDVAKFLFELPSYNHGLNYEVDDVYRTLVSLPYDNKMYNFYLSLPLANVTNHNINPLYANNWCVICGGSFAPPSQHRHYTYAEFLENLANNAEFIDFYNKHGNKRLETLTEMFKPEIGTPPSFEEFKNYFNNKTK